MMAFRREPYLWLHLAGIAVAPLWCLGTWLGIAAGESWFPARVELTLLVFLGAGPLLWMQWQRPFNPFCLLVVALPAARLTEAQRRWLSLLESNRTRLLALVGILPLVILLNQGYQLAPIATPASPFPNHLVGFGVAAIAFLLANLFVQVPLSMMGLLLVSEERFQAVEPVPVTAVSGRFLQFGVPVAQILPPLASAPTTATPPTPADTETSASEPSAETESPESTPETPAVETATPKPAKSETVDTVPGDTTASPEEPASQD